VAQGSPRDLIDAHVTREVLELRFPVGEQEAAASAIRLHGLGHGVTTAERVEALPDRVVVYADDGEAALAAIHDMELAPLTALVRRASLEDVFLNLTGRSLID
jgi:lipooligosaccharide transport system ATP-binding protein